MNIKKIFFETVRKNFLILILASIMSVTIISISMLMPFIMQNIIDNGILKSDMSLIRRLSLILIIIVILEYIFDILNTYFLIKVSKDFTKSIFKKLLKNLCLKSNDFFTNKSSGEINERINEAFELEDLFSLDFISSIYSLVVLIVSYIILIKINILIAIVTFCIVSISSLFIFLNNKYIEKKLHDVLEKRVNVSSKIQEIILGILDIRNRKAKRMLRDKTGIEINEKCKEGLKFSMGIMFYSKSSILFISLLSVFLIYFSGINILDGKLTIGEYFFITLYVEKISSSLMNATQTISLIKPLLVTSKRIEETFKLDSLDFSESENGNKENISKLIIKNLSFKYPSEDKNIISNFNLVAKKGEIILIKGKNGSGKSTLLKNINGEIKPQSGEILTNDNKEISREDVGIVNQIPFIFNLSLKDNILLGEDYDENKYKKIIEDFKFREYFDEKTLSGEEIINENGKNLSGGKIKLIALARCFYRNTNIIILDEAISNLDSNLREVFIDYIESVKENHIFIMALHTNEYDYLASKEILLF